MHQPNNDNRRSMMEKLAGSLMLLSFGLALLAYLIAIDRPEWFDLRPASGTAAAMSHASHARSDKTDAAHPAATDDARAGALAELATGDTHGRN